MRSGNGLESDEAPPRKVPEKMGMRRSVTTLGVVRSQHHFSHTSNSFQPPRRKSYLPHHPQALKHRIGNSIRSKGAVSMLATSSPPSTASLANHPSNPETAGKEKEKLRVAVRMRGMIPAELERQEKRCWRVVGNDMVASIKSTTDGKLPQQFIFDRVFGATSRNEDIYDVFCKSVVDGVLDGYNGCIFAYGQTASGKTHTMSGTAEQPGVIVQSLIDLLHVFKETTKSGDGVDKVGNAVTTTALLQCAFLEIYNEEIKDLAVSTVERSSRTGSDVPRHASVIDASPGSPDWTGGLRSTRANNRKKGAEKNKGLALQESARDGIQVKGLTYEPITTVEEGLEIIERGTRRRATAATSMNEDSSRSHSILRLVLEIKKTTLLASKKEQRQRQAPGSTSPVESTKITRSILNLVDLAGSESARKAGTEGMRRREGANINKSLLTLGTVIHELSRRAQGKRVPHVPYRDSKLTRLLQPCIGGNSHTVLIATASPTAENFRETRCTLRFARRASTIIGKVERNEIFANENNSQILALEHEVHRLRKQLQHQRKQQEQDIAVRPQLSSTRQASHEDMLMSLKKENKLLSRRVLQLSSKFLMHDARKDAEMEGGGQEDGPLFGAGSAVGKKTMKIVMKVKAKWLGLRKRKMSQPNIMTILTRIAEETNILSQASPTYNRRVSMDRRRLIEMLSKGKSSKNNSTGTSEGAPPLPDALQISSKPWQDGNYEGKAASMDKGGKDKETSAELEKALETEKRAHVAAHAQVSSLTSSLEMLERRHKRDTEKAVHQLRAMQKAHAMQIQEHQDLQAETERRLAVALAALRSQGLADLAFDIQSGVHDGTSDPEVIAGNHLVVPEQIFTDLHAHNESHKALVTAMHYDIDSHHVAHGEALEQMSALLMQFDE